MSVHGGKVSSKVWADLMTYEKLEFDMAFGFFFPREFA